MAKTVTVRIDEQHAALLVAGERIAIRVPAGTEVLRLQLTRTLQKESASCFGGMAKLVDVFFNGRKA